MNHLTSSYDKKSAKSIYEFSLQLTGKSLAEVVELPPDIENSRNRGDLGSLIERYFFKHIPQSNIGPDFPEAGLELKTTGVLQKSDGKYKPKERLVLGMINFDKIVKEDWLTSSIYGKCKKMLILFYLYSKDTPVSLRKFVIPPFLYEIPPNDLPVIKRDWESIRTKILEGKAHELSEGDTFFLGACRKGTGGTKELLRSQPFSDIPAKSRAFAFKQNYLEHLIQGHEDNIESIGVSQEMDFQRATEARFSPFLGKSIEQISSDLNHFKKSRNQKGFHRELAIRILAAGGARVIELEKAGIEMKTVRLQKNGRPKESMSFPGFDFMEILGQEWDETNFFEKIERKFLFVVFRKDDIGEERLEKVGYWNMPYEDRLEAERVWLETRKRVALNAHDLPGMSESRVAHVRPKARNGNDKAITPQGDYRTKQCFWLNARYIGEVVAGI